MNWKPCAIACLRRMVMNQLSELRTLWELESPAIQLTLKPWWLLIDFPDQDQAEEFQNRHEATLDQWSTRYRVLIAVQGEDKIAARPIPRGDRRMNSQPLILDPNAGLQLGRMKLGRTLLREMTYWVGQTILMRCVNFSAPVSEWQHSYLYLIDENTFYWCWLGKRFHKIKPL